MVMAATPRVSSSESSPARPGTLKRKLAAVAGAAGAAAIGAADAQAVTYTPTAGIAAAQGIPGFSFDAATTTPTLGNLRGPANVLGAVPTLWDIDGSGSTDFTLNRVYNAGIGFEGRLIPNPATISSVSAVALATSANKMINLGTGSPVSANVNWSNQFQIVTLNFYGVQNQQPQFTTGTPGQFGFFFSQGTDRYYGWGSLTVDSGGTGGGDMYVITEAYYSTTAGAAINVGAVPQVVPEPASMALLGLGAAGVAAWRARRKAKAEAATRAPTKVEV